MIGPRFALLLLLAALPALGGCSMRSMAADTVGEILASEESVFASDDDIELVGDALPFGLKLVEALLADSPNNRNLLLTAARGYTLYAYAYVGFPAEQAATDDIDRARQLRTRARKLYLRAFGYALRGLELDRPGFAATLEREPASAVAGVTGEAPRQVAFLYWAAASLGLAVSVSKNEPALLARLPEVEALLQRALALNEAFDDGALHEFAVAWAGAVPGARDRAAIEQHYRRAVALSAGRRASLYVAYAMTVAVPAQDRATFVALMEQALAVDPDAAPNRRLQTALAQRRARWLLARADELFLE